MVKVYFVTENDGDFKELVAVFADESLYQTCLPALELAACFADKIVTESIEGEDLSDKF